jgi:ribosome-associated protein
MDFEVFEIKTEYIELIKLLKAVGVASTGGAAKALVQSSQIKVNKIIELRLRCKLYHDFLVECNGIKIKIQVLELS